MSFYAVIFHIVLLIYLNYFQQPIDSRATASIPATVKNLSAVSPDIGVTGVIKAIKEQYKSVYNVSTYSF